MRTLKFTLPKSQGSLGAKYGKERTDCVRASSSSTHNWAYQGQPGTRLGCLDRVSATQHVQAYLLWKPRSFGDCPAKLDSCPRNPCAPLLACLSQVHLGI